MQLIAVCLGIFLFGSLIFPWINRSRLSSMRGEITELKYQLQQLYSFLEREGVKVPSNIKAEPKTFSETQLQPTPQTYREDTSSTHVSTRKPESEIKEKIIEKRTESIVPNIPKAPPVSQGEVKLKLNLEQQFGARLPVWIGGIALALAGFYMVKYSIETGLLSPKVRVTLGIVFGFVLLYLADLVRKRPNFANGTRIAQSLAGAGIADLYVCIFAATSLYHLFPVLFGFIGLALVTAAAVVLSLRHGAPIALMGMIGGFLTPAMVGSNNPQASVLFIYLYFVFLGLMLVIKKHSWWSLAIPTVIGAFIWILFWISSHNFIPGDAIWLGLFLFAISATVVTTTKEAIIQNNNETALVNSITLINYVALGGTLALMGMITAKANFGIMEWGLFAILSFGSIALAYLDQKQYGFLPWLSLAINAIMLSRWNTGDQNTLAITIALFALLYIVSGCLAQSRSANPIYWAGITATASIGYYLLGYYEIRDIALVINIPMFWGVLALIFAAANIILLVFQIKKLNSKSPADQALTTIYAISSTAFLSLALSIELPYEFLSVAFAAEVFAISWINNKVDIKILRKIILILACVFGYLLIPQIALLIQLTFFSLVEARISLQEKLPIVDWPLFQLGLPALFFGIGSILLRKQKDDSLVKTFEISAIALFAVMAYYFTRHIFNVDQNVIFVKAGFIERGVISNLLFIYALTCLFLGRKFTRSAISFSGVVLFLIASFRIGYFDFFIHNPLWSSQNVGKLPVLNALLITYGLPIVWVWRGIQELPYLKKEGWSKLGYTFILLLSFALVSLNVRQFFGGNFLNLHSASNVEIYAYSIVWLLFGISLLLLGTHRKNKMIRLASLAVMILTVGKVFLYDASELEGLFRVFSFFGLGLSLLVLSWFYTRFVFEKENLQSS